MGSNSLGLIFQPRNPPSRRRTTARFSSYLSRDAGSVSSSARIKRSSNMVERGGLHYLARLPTLFSQQAASLPARTGTNEPASLPFIECVVCRNDVERDRFPNCAPSAACTHPPEVCLECLRRTIEVAITAGNFLSGISCPSAACSGNLDYFEVKKWAKRETFERHEHVHSSLLNPNYPHRYDRLLLQASLRAEVPSYILCVSPTCGAGQEHIGGGMHTILKLSKSL
jgi:hypothetical protein